MHEHRIEQVCLHGRWIIFWIIAVTCPLLYHTFTLTFLYCTPDLFILIKLFSYPPSLDQMKKIIKFNIFIKNVQLNPTTGSGFFLFLTSSIIRFRRISTLVFVGVSISFISGFSRRWIVTGNNKIIYLDI